MPDPKQTASGKSIVKVLRAIWHMIVRVWALAIMVMVVGTGYLAISYLIDYVFSPVQVPPQILDWRSKLEPQMLRSFTAEKAETEAPRAPLGHYHKVNEWYEPAPYLSCTISGCHSPLPHQKPKAIRAFANMHATFMTCLTCHEKNTPPGMATVWLDPKSGATLKHPPPLLQLLDLLEKKEQPDNLQAFTNQVINLLGQSLAHMYNEPLLELLKVQLQTTEPESPVWTATMRDLRTELPKHARGEYGARLAPAADGRDYTKFHEAIKKLAKQYFSDQEDVGRDKLKKQIHQQVNPRPSGCLACHGGEPPRIDFVEAGYTQQRADSLRDVVIADLMQRLLQGQTFHLPKIILPGAEPVSGSKE